METSTPIASTSYQRYHSLDLIRGIAVLAILAVNIWAFAMPFSAYANPPMYGDFSGIHELTWLLSFVVIQEKFITLFSILFGAGIALFHDHAASKNVNAKVLHFRRMGILLLIGLVHAYGFWSGDILVSYALLGMLVYFFLSASNKTLGIWVAALIFIGVLLILMLSMSMPHMPEADLNELRDFWAPSPEKITAEIQAMRSGFIEQLPERAANTLELQTMVLSFYSFRLLAHMLIGIFLYRSGFLLGKLPAQTYRRLAVVAFAIGIPMCAYGATRLLSVNFAMEQAMGSMQLWNNIGSLIMAFGYMSLFVLWSKSDVMLGVRQRLQNAGRMAFTLYLGSTLICTTLFNGHGFGLFGQVERFQQALIVLAIWLVLIFFAHWWLASHKQGPLEAFWRFLTYGRSNNESRASTDVQQ